MPETGERMVDKDNMPGAQALADWLGEEMYSRWEQVTNLIADRYPGVFVPEWLFGGKKHGWNLRYKKSKSFCTLIPEFRRFMIQIVLGAAEREKTEAILQELTPQVSETYEAATTYHDGKWLFFPVDSDAVICDVERLLAVKRRPSA